MHLIAIVCTIIMVLVWWSQYFLYFEGVLLWLCSSLDFYVCYCGVHFVFKIAMSADLFSFVRHFSLLWLPLIMEKGFLSPAYSRTTYRDHSLICVLSHCLILYYSKTAEQILTKLWQIHYFDKWLFENGLHRLCMLHHPIQFIVWIKILSFMTNIHNGR